MQVKVLKESGFEESLFAPGFSFGITGEMTFEEFLENTEVFNRMHKVAKNLAGKGNGHDSFMELIEVWLDVDAPRYWHSERDRYRMSEQFSESTMHTVQKRKLNQDDFEDYIPRVFLETINYAIEEKLPLLTIKNMLPEGFLQRRIIKMNYKTLRNVLVQREGHRLPQWQIFNDAVMGQLKHPELLGLDKK